jgi:hypothetical protein
MGGHTGVPQFEGDDGNRFFARHLKCGRLPADGGGRQMRCGRCGTKRP